MRMRKKKNLPQRMERAAAVLIPEPEAYRGRWRESFPGYARLFAELGCGKGSFTAGTAQAEKGAFLVALERVPDAMIMAMEKAVAAELANVRFIDTDVNKLSEIFARNDIRSIPLTRMTVPCCGGLEYAVKKALERSGKDIPCRVVTIDLDGTVAAGE